jgi:hypothetical protein
VRGGFHVDPCCPLPGVDAGASRSVSPILGFRGWSWPGRTLPVEIYGLSDEHDELGVFSLAPLCMQPADHAMYAGRSIFGMDMGAEEIGGVDISCYD